MQVLIDAETDAWFRREYESLWSRKGESSRPLIRREFSDEFFALLTELQRRIFG
jgi:hypothetical protein